VGVAVFPDCENTPILDGAPGAVVGVSRRLAICNTNLHRINDNSSIIQYYNSDEPIVYIQIRIQQIKIIPRLPKFNTKRKIDS